MVVSTTDHALFSFVITYSIDSTTVFPRAAFSERGDLQSVNSESALNSTTYG
jgi:hypothetical protein